MGNNIIDEIRQLTPVFDGQPDGPTWEHWRSAVNSLIEDLLPNSQDATRYRITMTLLHPEIKMNLFRSRIEKGPDFYRYMKDRYPNQLWANYFSEALHNRTLFKGMDIHAAKARAKEAGTHLGKVNMWCTQITAALLAEFKAYLSLAPNYFWKFEDLTYEGMCNRLDEIEVQVLEFQGREASLRNASGGHHRQEPTRHLTSSWGKAPTTQATTGNTKEARWLQGLPAETFIRINPQDDKEFRMADEQYPVPTRTSVDERLRVQTKEAPRSKADREFMDGYIKNRLKYGIDEPGQAHANLPVYSLPKPNTDARRVILDDSLGSTINMYSLGMRLPKLLEVRAFVSDAQMITSIDLASYFTQIRIKPEVRDFWTFDGGRHGKDIVGQKAEYGPSPTTESETSWISLCHKL
ncbi:hypothetical protein BJ085DRAFT_39873 [Dimargaris cristalligena]|uniref:Reverse transcriptase domain-containing protein n=1 Tax=Dimargaris cristalligena TaxID=215637 RepID=A0A4P9ZKA2_9FUNG|nr:hypothetical protein BJ085DRAFT_39873 [Dimargaris cristalligena]|eukprot:RKP33696.1 hypothetical protein BJ085DRAFT_39873 [Dimargaris cristalligena]